MTQKQVVALSFDLEALKHSMRFAFANDLTVIQELIQNARRAGATTVWVTTGLSADGSPTVAIIDNGRGLEDFSVLLRVATSGWNDETKANEGPYGLGFMSAVYSAKHVEVVSLGKVLRMDRDRVLADGKFEVEDYEEALPDGAVTAVTLHGIDATKVTQNIEHLVRGYAIDVICNGRSLPRPDSLDGSYRATTVGHVKRNCTAYGKGHVRVYLQGFCVHSEMGGGYRSVHYDVVHLDPTKWHGKFPDRDVVINQADMLAAVQEQLRALYVESLLEAKKRLPPGEFVETYHSLAQSLGMLKVFNDVDVLPKSFFRQVEGMPHDTEYPGEFLQQGQEGEFFTRADLEAPGIVVGQLEMYSAEDDVDNTRRWVFAYASNAWMLRTDLDDEHWVYHLVSLHEESDVTMRPVGVTRKRKVDSYRLHCVGTVELVLCDDIEVILDGSETLLLGVPVYDEENATIYVPIRDGAPMYIDSSVIQQVSSYRWDDDFHEDERDEDERAINQMVRELASDTPEEQLALSIEAAISSYSNVRKLTCTIEVDAAGKVKVLSMSTKD